MKSSCVVYKLNKSIYPSVHTHTSHVYTHTHTHTHTYRHKKYSTNGGVPGVTTAMLLCANHPTIYLFLHGQTIQRLNFPGLLRVDRNIEILTSQWLASTSNENQHEKQHDNCSCSPMVSEKCPGHQQCHHHQPLQLSKGHLPL